MKAFVSEKLYGIYVKCTPTKNTSFICEFQILKILVVQGFLKITFVCDVMPS